MAGTDDAPRPGPGGAGPFGPAWPTPQQLVGVWAGVASQLWDLSVAWLKMGVEQVASEDERLRSTSAVVSFPCPATGSVAVTCSRMASVAGETIPPAAVTVVPDTVDAVDDSPGTVELRVEVDRPAAHAEHLYEFTLTDGTREVTYLRAFGVPAS